MVVLDAHNNTVGHVTCSSTTGSGLVSADDAYASVDPKTIMGVPSPHCARTK